MLSINKRKYLKSLNTKKYRLIENKIVIEGFRMINDAIDYKVYFEHIWISEKQSSKTNCKKLVYKLKQNKIPYSFESKINIKSLSSTQNSQGIIGLININQLYNSELINFGNRIIILDKISDPGNLGTIIRTCAWFGIDSLILSEGSADIFNPKCIRAGMSGHFYLKHFSYLNYKQINEFTNLIKHPIYHADLDGESMNNIKSNKKWILILGSEAHGLNNKIKIGNKITISKKGNVESLNVSIACGIILNHLTR